jgi:hypothetical protein
MLPRISLFKIAAFWLCLPCMAFPPSSMAAKTRSAVSLDSHYARALAAADRLLQAWQTGDIEHGIALLTSHAKQSASSNQVENFFSNSGASGYEIGRGKLLQPGRYEFPVALVDTVPNHHIFRHFSTIVVVNTGNNDWAVDKLP